MSAGDGNEATAPPAEGALRFLLLRAAPHRALLIVGLTAACLSGLLALAPALVIHGIAARVLSDDAAASGIVLLAFAGLAAVTAGLALAIAANVLGHKIAFSVQKELRLDILRRLERTPVSSVEGKAGEIKKIALGDVDRLEGLLAHVLPDMAAGLIAPASAAIILAFVDWRVALASLALLPLVWLAQYWTWHGRGPVFEKWNRTEAEANSAMLSYVRGIATLKAFNRQASTLHNVRTSVWRLRDLAVEVTRRSRHPYSLFNSALSTNLLIVLPAALLFHRSGAIDSAEFVLVVMLGAGLTAPLNKVVFAATIVARTSVAVDRIRSILDGSGLPDQGGAALPAGNTIRFEKVGFAYPDGRTVLHEIDLDIPEGGMTALVGPSGAGKSTLARLLPRFEDCTSGSIRLGGIDIRELSLADLRSRIGAVFQDAILFHGSVEDNIAMAAPGATAARLAAAAKAARLDGGGFDDLQAAAGDRGARLSGGERQRVAIARAIIKDAPILVLDEATAFVDAENEAEVQAALSAAGRGRTMLVIAHRLASVENADQIVVLNNGRVEACGRHADLIHKSPTYGRLWAAQQSATGWRLGRRGVGVET